MTLDQIMTTGIEPALQLLPEKLDSPIARVMLLSIGLQESRFLYRRQIVGGRAIGAAKSYWQGERTGGMVRGVRTHPASQGWAHTLYKALGVRALDLEIWNQIEHDDVLAAGLARLLLWTDPFKLPALGDAQGGWKLYERTWRPGRPHRASWDAYYRRSLAYVTEAEQ